MEAAESQETTDPAQLDAALAGFEAAATSAGRTEQWYEIAGHPVLLRLAGDAVAERLAPALAHLVTEPRRKEPRLTVAVWDSESTGTPLDAGAGSLGLHAQAGRVPHHTRPPLLSSYGRGETGLSLFDPARRLACYWHTNASQIPYWERSGPLRAILSWWAELEGLQFVHAAAVGTSDGGVLIVGRNGSGKSTSALASLEGGLLYAGDDHVLVEPGDPPWVHSIYSAGKVHLDNRHRVPDLARHAIDSSREGLIGDAKALVYLAGICPERIARGFPLRAILVPKVTGGETTRVVATAPSEAFSALSPSSVLQLPGTRATALREQAALARTVPTYRLELGGPVEQVPHVIRDLLEDG